METHKFIELEEAKIAKDINFLIQTSSLLIESRQEEKGGVRYKHITNIIVY